MEALEAVGFGPALERVGGLDAEHDWPNALTPGEQQLLAFARLLLARPSYAVLDHVTDALPPDQAGPLLRRLTEASIAYVSFVRGPRPARRARRGPGDGRGRRPPRRPRPPPGAASPTPEPAGGR